MEHRTTFYKFKKSPQQLEPDACGRYSTRDCSGYEKIVLISDQVGAHLIFVSSFDNWDFGTELQNIQDILQGLSERMAKAKWFLWALNFTKK